VEGNKATAVSGGRDERAGVVWKLRVVGFVGNEGSARVDGSAGTVGTVGRVGIEVDI